MSKRDERDLHFSILLELSETVEELARYKRPGWTLAFSAELKERQERYDSVISKRKAALKGKEHLYTCRELEAIVNAPFRDDEW